MKRLYSILALAILAFYLLFMVSCETNSETTVTDGDVDSIADGDVDSEQDFTDSVDLENSNNMPTPIIEIPEDYKNPEPLDMIHLDGRNSTSPFGDDRKPFQYFWEWAPDGRPQNAQDAVLIATAGSFDNPRSIMGKWTAEGYPKIYLPIAGIYRFRLKVKDSAGVVSGQNDDCPTCSEWCQIEIVVRPSQKLHVELLWDKGDGVDMDIFLVRYREDGTFAIRTPINDKLTPIFAKMPSCTTADDCFDGAFECNTTNNFCVNHCDTDDECKAVDRGWFCNGVNECQENELNIVECNKDEDCGADAFCNPAEIGQNTYKMICTHHNGLALNDTCSFIYKEPKWGTFDDVTLMCVDDSDCNAANYDEFTCGGNDCNFACESSNQCLTFSEQFLCSPESVCVDNNLDDDPTLDLDDVNGWGPENISLKEPDSGRYRVVVRLYADPIDVVSQDSFVKAYVHIYQNGQLALVKSIGHEIADVNTYWKVADIVWDQDGGVNNEGDGYVEPICAGWTLTTCTTNEECTNWFSDEYSCDTKESGKYCNCSGTNEFGLFENNPYANPFINNGGAIFSPLETLKRSMWCDSADAKTMSIPGEGDVNILSSGEACSTLYSE